MAAATPLHDVPYRTTRDANRPVSPTGRFCLSRDDIAGPFTLIDKAALRIDAVPGLVVHVRAAGVTISRARAPGQDVVRAGERFVSDHAGEMMIEPHARVELHLDWPGESPGPVFPPNSPR